jgi:hypothetical protein
MPVGLSDGSTWTARSGVDNEVLIGIKMIPLAHQQSYVIKILAEPIDCSRHEGFDSLRSL